MPLSDHIEIIHHSTSQQVADGIVNMILGGTMQPGERLKESVIAQSLGLSRNTVREAVRLIQGGGLVRYQRGRGMVVWDPTDDEIMDVYRARFHLETAAARLAGEGIRLDAVEQAIADFSAALPTENSQLIVQKDLAVHSAIVALLGSDQINAFYAQLIVQVRYFMLILSLEHYDYERIIDVDAELRRILAALESGDPALAEGVIGEVVTRNRDVVRQILSARRPQNAASADMLGESQLA